MVSAPVWGSSVWPCLTLLVWRDYCTNIGNSGEIRWNSLVCFIQTFSSGIGS